VRKIWSNTSAVGWPGYWGLEGPEYLAWLDQSPERHYTALMGATTYRLMSDFAAFDGGLQLLDYVPTVLTGPPSGGQHS
jgi:hypothetical protein